MKRRAVLTGIICLGLAIPRRGYSILGVADIVSDPLNLAQNTLTAIRSLLSNANEVTQIQNQVASLVNEAKMLATLPLSLINEIDQAIRGYTDLLNAGQGMAYQLKASVGQFEELYNQGFGGSGTFFQRAQRMIGQIREAGRLATQMTAVYDRLCAQQTRVGQLMAASQAAIGPLQAEQAGNQLMGVMVEQQVSIQGILATDQRLKISETMRQLVREEQAAQNAQQYLMLAAPPANRPNQGFMLPE